MLAQRAGGLLLLAFGVLGGAGLWTLLPAPLLLVGFGWLPGHVALAPCRWSCRQADCPCPAAGPGGLALELAFSLVLLTVAVFPLFLVHANLAVAGHTLGGACLLLGAASLALPVQQVADGAGNRCTRGLRWIPRDWVPWALASLALLPAVLVYAGGTVDDWWDLAFVTAYANADRLSFAEPVLGSGRVHPRFTWNAWLVLQALVAEFSSQSPSVLQARWLAPLTCLLTVAATSALATALFGTGRRVATAGAVLFVPLWLYGTEALPFFTRLHQDKFVAGLVLVPTLVATAAAWLRYRHGRLLVLTAIAGLAVSLMHGLLFAIGLVGVGALVLADATRVGAGPAAAVVARVVRCWPLAAALVPAAVAPLWQALRLRGLFAAQGIDLAASDNPVVRAHLWLDRLLWPHDWFRLVNPAAVFGAVGLVAAAGVLVACARRRGDGAARTLLWLTGVPCALIFVPVLAAAVGNLVIPWMLYRLGWLVPVPLLAGLLLERALALQRPASRWAATAAVVLVSAGLVVPVVADRLARGMFEHPFPREHEPRGTTRQVYEFLARQPRGEVVLAPVGISSLVPALGGHPTVATTERGTLVFAGEERDAYRRLRDRASFFAAASTPVERERIVSDHGVSLAVFRRRLVTTGSDARWLASSSSEGFVLAYGRDGTRLWSHDPAAVARALPPGWNLVMTNRDFIVARRPPGVVERDGDRDGDRDGHHEDGEEGRRWLAPFRVDPRAVAAAGSTVLASTVGYPAAAVTFDPVPLTFGISDRPVWTGARQHWEDGPTEVSVRLELAGPCRVDGVEVVPFLNRERREVLELSVAGVTRRLRAVDGEALYVAVPPVLRREVDVSVRSMLGASFGLADVRVRGDRATCEGGWRPLLQPRWPDHELSTDERLTLARGYPRTARAVLGVSQGVAGDGDLADARALVRLALQADRSASAVWVELGLLRDDAALPDAALLAYRRAVAADSNSAWAHGCLAWAELRRDMLLPSLYHGWRAVRLDARYADAHTILATTIGRLGARTMALSLLERAVELDPRRNWAYLELARMLHEDGRTEDALRLLSSLLELVPDDEQAQDLREMLVGRAAARDSVS